MIDTEVVALEVPELVLERRLGLVRRIGRTPGNASAAFAEIAREQARKDMA